MPRKVRPPPDAPRNRANQRECRARRRAYVADLERRVRDHEARGVQATREVQMAARAVARRNERLMLLLERLGVGRGVVEGFVRADEGDGEGGDLRGSGGIGGIGGGGDGDVMPVGDRGRERGGEEEREREEGGGCMGVLQRPDSAGPNVVDDDVDVDVDAARRDDHPITVCDGGVATTITTTTTASAEEGSLITSCDQAAVIIAGLQGHGDATQARRSLGCETVRNCHVKNTRLFQLMDEATT
ncbi:hypothetical protein F4778DRAFT_795958 [Xylariomycetidae sp. FL2044]|nr:hypothetical protein F4778DRAFT_795958 [Xylariomycetidae sp. FL2044]